MTGYRASYANVDANRQQMLAGIQLLQQGDFARARQTFESLLAAGARDPGVLTALAMACRGDHAPDAALAAVSEALSLDPSNPRGLLLRGDLAADAGDPRSASAYYQGAIESARGIAALPADLNRQLQQAASYCDRQARAIDALIESELASHEGLVPGPRFRESIDILMGRKPIRVQQPRFFYFPGLANITFFDRSRFGFLDALEAQTDAIREELLAVMRDEREFEPYVRRDPARPAKNQQDIVDNPAWSAYYLWKDGAPVDDHLAACPKTAKALESIPLVFTPNRSPSVLFSLLRPGAHIPAHHGLVNTRLIGHLPLIVPPDCVFRVGNDVRDWQEGKAWVFDDSIEHEAWNNSNRTRVILLFEIWRPELSEAERTAVNALFAALDKQGGPRVAWDN